MKQVAFLLFALFSFVAFALASQTNNAPHCPRSMGLGSLGANCRFSSQCQCGKQEVDFVLELDASTSMCDKINTAQNGLIRFVLALEATQSVDYRLAVLRFGGKPLWLTTWTTNVTEVIAAISAIECTASGREAGFEMLRMVHQAANDNNIGRRVIGSSADMSFRFGALPYHIMITDENSDSSVTSANRWPDQLNQEPPDNFWAESHIGWQQELINTTNILIGAQAALAAWINPGVAPTNFQYGPTATQVGDYTYFDRTQTIINSEAANLNYGKSLQIAMIKANLNARIFDIYHVGLPDAVDGFFDTIVRSVNCGGKASCSGGRRDTCLAGRCARS